MSAGHRAYAVTATGVDGKCQEGDILIPLELFDVRLGGLWWTEVVESSAASPLIVDVDEDRPKDEVRGARCVSFSSVGDETVPSALC